ncbi:urate hydroxylase PuuD [Nordella sp. HKS 07]|uniref:urate hydroxylase PuuD n=1 Tax=Nordella sp. HKS 07 TaxID=2712222 RepID=UPI0013E1F0C5|nr:urate hydroxylase PuuD [Nordella sp. HKS 07]QIG49682.1 urate hydroxylase PuuD [Nordella sp. HKS 07]
MLDPFIADWLNLLLRWAHMIAGIAWIGTSFYFVALDFSLKRRAGLPAGVYGEAWEVHGGGFYHVQKYSVAPTDLPPDLIWFKWEAYLTWVTGFLLLIVQFYFNATTFLIDPSILPLTPWQAIGISLAGLAAGWFIYDGLCRSPLVHRPGLLALAVFVLILIAAYGFTHVFSGRGALIHVGAFIGTMMAANVFAVIIPNQRKITAALLRGEAPDPKFGITGKQRSLHNTYLTLPVLLMMISNHYPMITNHPQAWILIGLIVIGGASLRHFLVRHEVGDGLEEISWTLPVIFGALAAALWLTEPAQRIGEGLVVSDAEVQAITVKHCVMCHAVKPVHAGFKEAPKGVALETLDELRRYATQIETQAVRNKSMPLGNETAMTDEDRAKLGAWIAAQ